MTKIHIYLILILIGLNSAYAQNLYLKDFYTSEPISFGKIYPEFEKPFLSDIDGKFNLTNANQRIAVKATSYRDTTITLTNGDSIIFLIPNLKSLENVTVKPGINPAEVIMVKVIENRKKNHPLENDGFISKQYSKYIFDVDQETRKNIFDTIIFPKPDSNIMRARNFLDNQYFFITESASRHFFEPPYKEKEIIDAFKVSGISDPLFSTFAQEMQSFHFYENQVSVLGKQYVNPIAFGSLNRYLFVLEDSTFNQNDTTYTIYYRPRLNKNFDGLTGRLFINTNGYAIEKVVAEPYIRDTSGIDINIVQEYRFTNNTKWFPYKLSTTIDLKTAMITYGKEKNQSGFLQGKGSTYIESVSFNPKELAKERFNNVSIQTSDKANKISDTTWNRLRQNELNSKELKTYHVVDSFAKAENLDKYLFFAKVLATGKIPVSFFNIDLKRVFNYNAYEKYRFGLGIETSEKLIKPLLFGVYFGYGTGDKTFKYGGYSTLFLNRKTETKLNLYIQSDVSEVGATKPFFSPGLFSNESLRYLFVSNMAMQEKYGATFSTTIRSNMGIQLDVNRHNLNFNNDYQYNGLSTFNALETSLIWSWNIREKVNLIGNQRVSMGTIYPRLQVQFDRGWIPTDYIEFLSYSRLNLSISQNVTVIGIGKLSWSFKGGIANGNVPLNYFFALQASRQNWSVSVPNSFETVGVNEFYHKKSASVFTRFTFNAIRTKAKWNQPQFGFHYAYGIGEFENKLEHNIEFKSMNKGLHEAGIFLNGLLTSGNSSIGLGSFYRFGYYSNEDWKKNIVPKIVVGFTF
jgi:hypothetical protein